MSDIEHDDRARRVTEFLRRHGLERLAPARFDLSMTHRSYAYEADDIEEDNERLEFLGDAVVGLVASEDLYRADPAAREGLLSKRRGVIVSREALARRAAELGLSDLLMLGRGERETGGANRPSNLGCALEALIGAIFLDLGHDAAREFTREHVLAPLADLIDETADEPLRDYKSALQEWTQARFKTLPTYVRLSEDGPDHDKRFRVRVEVDGQPLAEATATRIKQAENEAARLALERLETPSSDSP